MGLLAGFAAGAAQGVQGGWADNREVAMEKAKEQMQMRMQDRAIAKSAEQRATIKSEQLADFKNPDSLMSLQSKAASNATQAKYAHELQKEEIKSRGKSDLKSLKDIVLGQDLDGKDIKVTADIRTGQILDPTGRLTRPTLSIEEAMETMKDEASNKAGYLSSDKADFGMDRDEWIRIQAEKLVDESTLANKFNIDVSKIVSNIDGQPSGLLNQGASQARPSGGRPRTILPESATGDKGADNPAPDKPVADSKEDALLAKYGLDNIEKINGGDGLGDTLKKDPVIGGLINSYKATSDAVDYYANKGVKAASKALANPPEITDSYKKKLEKTLEAFRQSPTVEMAKKIVNSGLMSAEEKKAIEIFIKRNG